MELVACGCHDHCNGLHHLCFCSVLHLAFGWIRAVLTLCSVFSYPFSFNQAKPKNDVETRVYEVLSHKNWGASSSIMNEIARDTYESDRCK